jgi:hypothetical protein
VGCFSHVRRTVAGLLDIGLRDLFRAGAKHLQLVLDPITVESIDTIGAVLADLDR